ncbi:TIGR02677 family protein [Streptomyces sp. VNUA24]|uniref:TIGR02677 family protein n=1 Tax=Streptomyces sp. VNUA24 TaxID=3031131 RepID=UPI0023B792D0|nr:TIGR02677 family protein [Streptomyces sp. VNUA24]WEH20127.1 TIGR02677 family protein [Streptomyces sp. VNUA24]
MFRFTTGETPDLDGAVLDAFGAAAEHLETELGPDAVRAWLRRAGRATAVEDDALRETLGRLARWELLDVLHDHPAKEHSAAAEHERHHRTAEDFGGHHRSAVDHEPHPRRAEEHEPHPRRYSLTRRGEAALAGVRSAGEVLGSTGALRTAVLDAIADRLDELCLLSGEPASADRRIFTALRELEGHLETLVEDTTAFNGELQRLLRAESADPEAFREVRAATVAHLQEFLADLDLRGRRVAAAVARVEERGSAGLRERALRGAGLPPSAAPDPVAGADPVAGWLENRRARWAVLRSWFRPEDGARPRIERLHAIARRALAPLLEALERNDASRRPSSGAAQDFRELARWFAAAPAEEDLHRLWSAAFGLGPARHAHLAHPDPELIPSSRPWAETPPVEVSALLRSSGRTERFTRTARVRDVTAVRAERAERARAERAELALACRMLQTRGPVRLSAFGELEPAVFDRLLDLLGRALSTRPDTAGLRRATTGDGRVEIALAPPPDARTALLRTARGTLAGPDYVVRITEAGGAAAPPATPAAASPAPRPAEQAPARQPWAQPSVRTGQPAGPPQRGTHPARPPATAARPPLPSPSGVSAAASPAGHSSALHRETAG